MTVATRSTPYVDVVNPYDGARLAELPMSSAGEVERAVSAAEAQLSGQNTLSRQARSEILQNAAMLLHERRDKTAHLISSESGKIIRQARRETERAIGTLKLASAEALRLRGEEIPFDGQCGNHGMTGYYSREPIGLVAAITPFNDPLNLAIHKVAPAIAAGAPIVLKPSELAPLSALALRQLLLEAGLPEASFQILLGGAKIGYAVTTHPATRMISFTGGEQTADKIVRAAGVRTYSFDLGGNAPVIVTDSADLHQAVTRCVSGAFWANGHNCVGVQRILVDEAVFDQFTDAFLNAVKTLKTGDPTNPDTDLGPVIDAAHADRLSRVIEASQTCAPHSLVWGGQRDGNTIQPTVFINPNDMTPCVREEVFGPIVSVQSYQSLDEAITRANATETALNAGVFSQNIDEAIRVSEALNFGAVMINESSDFRFDNMPFGGAKRGGVGREGVRFAIEQMTQTKVRAFFSGPRLATGARR